MLITYLRSSSYTAWDFCPMKYFLAYGLGWKEPSGKKACLGNIVHKALEGLARKKLAQQRGEATFADAETGTVFDAAVFDAGAALAFAWDHYTRRETHHEWLPRDLRQCRRWTDAALELNGGMWNPLNRTVVEPELYFDVEVGEPWARYAHALPGGGRLEGRLALRGTVDLVTDLGGGVLEYQDWKTGLRKDWATGKAKDWKALRDDPQLRIYHYALSRVYPAARHIVFTVVFVQDGGAFSLDFGPGDLPRTLALVRARFEAVRDCARPRRIIGDRAHRWKCSKLCHFGRTNFVDPAGRDTGVTLCDHVHRELLAVGMDRVVARHGDLARATSYGEGGGRSAK